MKEKCVDEIFKVIACRSNEAGSRAAVDSRQDARLALGQPPAGEAISTAVGAVRLS
jgi:hypothetical protein